MLLLRSRPVDPNVAAEPHLHQNEGSSVCRGCGTRSNPARPRRVRGVVLRGTGLFPAACAIPFVSILQFPGSLMPLAFPRCLLHSWGKCHQVGGSGGHREAGDPGGSRLPCSCQALLTLRKCSGHSLFPEPFPVYIQCLLLVQGTCLPPGMSVAEISGREGGRDAWMGRDPLARH